MENSQLKRSLGIFLSLLAAACFALLPLFTLPLIKEGISVPAIMAYRFLVGSIILAGILLSKKERILVSMAGLLKLAALSLSSYLFAVCYAEALRYMASGPVTSIQFLYPIMVMIIMILFFHEKFHWYMVVAVLFAVLGVTVISLGSGDSDSSSGSLFLGIALSLAAGLWSALYYVGIKVLRVPQVDSLLMTFYIALFGMIYSGIHAVFDGSLHVICGYSNWGLLILLAILTIVISNLALIQGIKLVGPTMSSILGVTEPLTAVIIGVAVFGEALTFKVIAGVTLIIFSVLTAIVGPHILRNNDAA